MEFINNLATAPKISIIITFHNLGKYIRDCVWSILKQTYQNFEIIIVNDASDPEEALALQKIKNDKTTIINLAKNKGQLLAFLEGVKHSSGEFICMVDADDVLYPNYLQTLLWAHLNYKYALICASGGEITENGEITSLNYLNKNSKKINNTVSLKQVEKIFNHDETFEIKEVKAPFGLWSWSPSTSGMFRRSALDILNYFPDKEYWTTGADKVVFSLLHLIGGSANISSVCYLYRHHSKNSSQTTLTTGNKKYLNEVYTKLLITWNKKLRLDTYKMFKTHKAELIERYNNLNYSKMLLSIAFCFDTKFCAKAIKAFAHKILSFKKS